MLLWTKKYGILFVNNNKLLATFGFESLSGLHDLVHIDIIILYFIYLIYLISLLCVLKTKCYFQ